MDEGLGRWGIKSKLSEFVSAAALFPRGVRLGSELFSEIASWACGLWSFWCVLDGMSSLGLKSSSPLGNCLLSHSLLTHVSCLPASPALSLSWGPLWAQLQGPPAPPAPSQG